MVKIFIKTFGCRLNLAESESIAYQLKSLNCVLTNSFNDSEIVIVNSCTVTSKADKKVRYFISKSNKNNKTIFITGCFTNIKLINNQNIFYIPLRQKNLIPNYIKKFIDQKVFNINNIESPFVSPSLDKIYHSRAFLKIQDGCNQKCSYCKVTLVRGNSISEKPSIVIKNIKSLLNNNFKEIILTGINLAAYNYEKTNLTLLLENIININKNFWLQLSSLEINYLNGVFFKIIKNPKIKPFFHLCLQSGSNKILISMKRQYKIKDFVKFINKIKISKTNPYLSTDLIIGYPGENNEEFEKTFKLLKKIQFQNIHCFPFSPREGTEAYKIKETCSHSLKKNRIKKIKKLTKKYLNKYLNYFIGNSINFIVEDITIDNKVKGKSYNNLEVFSCNSLKSIKKGEIATGIVIGKKENVLMINIKEI